LTSSSQILIASSADLPLGASGPVSAMPKPILIGSPCCARVGAWNRSAAPAAKRPAASQTNARRLRCRNMRISSRVAIFVDVYAPNPACAPRGIDAMVSVADSWPVAFSAENRYPLFRKMLLLLRRIAAFDDDGFDLPRAAAPECRGVLVF